MDVIDIIEHHNQRGSFTLYPSRRFDPNLAWPMIGSWLPNKNPANHLAEALGLVLKAWINAGDEKNTVRFLRRLWRTEWLVDENPRGNPFVQLKRKDVLRDLYRLHRREFGGQPAPVTIPIWIEINEALSLMLLPDPVACATEIFSKLENEPHRTPSLATITWLAADTRRGPVGSNAREAVSAYLLSPVGGPETAAALARLVRNTKQLSEARILAETWSKLFADEPESVDVVCALVKRAGNSEEFLAWASERFARLDDARPETAKFLAALVEKRPQDRQTVSVWAWNHVLKPESGRVWIALLTGSQNQASEDILRGVLKWLAANPEYGESDTLRRHLLGHYPHACGAAWVMQEWAKRHPADKLTPEFLTKLLEAQPNNRTASAVVLAWFDQSLTHPSGAALLRRLLKHPDLALQAAAERWFDANPDSESYAEILAELIRLTPAVKWMARGEQFVAGQRPGREHVLAALLPACGCQLPHVEMAMRLQTGLSVPQGPFWRRDWGNPLSGIRFRRKRRSANLPARPRSKAWRVPCRAAWLGAGMMNLCGICCQRWMAKRFF